MKFQHWIIALSGLLVTALSGIFLLTVFSKFQEAAQTSATEKFTLIAERSADQLQALLSAQAQRAVLLAAGDLAGSLTRQQLAPADTLAILRTSLRQQPSLYSEYIAMANEDFVQAIDVNDDPTIRRALHAPKGTLIAQRIITADASGQRIETWQFLGPRQSLLSQRQAPAKYQPTQRPWYRGAIKAPGTPFVTQPYLFASTQSSGVTIAAAMPQASGAYGIDISLHILPRLLATFRTSDNAFIGILDDQNRMLGAHGRGLAAAAASDAPLTPLEQSGDPRLRTLASWLEQSGADRSVTVQLADQPHILATRTLNIGTGGQYRIVTWAPTSDFTTAVDQARHDVLLIASALLLLLVPLAFLGTRGIAGSLANMAADSERLRQLDFSAEPHSVHSFLYEIDALGKAQEVMHRSIRERTEALELAQAKLSQIVQTGIQLGRDQNRDNLLRHTLFGARDLAHCQAATLFLKTEHQTLRFAVRTSDDPLPTTELPLYDSAGKPIHHYVATHVALSGETVVIDDIYHETRFDVSGTQRFSEESGMRVVSTLNVPLKPSENKVIGLLQLMNALDPKTGNVIPFDADIVSFVEALAAQAAVALENQNLLEAQKNLLDSMIQIIAGAIDTKSPYTGGHCERVPELATLLAQQACKVQDGPLADFAFKTEEEWREFRIGAWLHDCGKVTTPEFVVDKATKLETIFNRIHEVRTRFEVLLRDADIARLRAIHEHGEDPATAEARFQTQRAQLQDDFAFVAECNLGGEFMAPDKVERLQQIARQTWMRHFDDRLGLAHDELQRCEREPAAALPAPEPLLADKPRHLFERPPTQALDERYGFKLKVPEYLYNHGEVYNLSIGRGTLTEEERFKINEHIIQTIVMLEHMPLPPNLRRVPEYAGTHHETLLGTGYPRQLQAKDLSVPSRIMAIADIFEALTASDRPYKKAKTLSESIKILSFFKKDGHIDPVLFDLFLTSGTYQTYAEKYLLPEQIDEVDITPYLG